MKQVHLKLLLSFLLAAVATAQYGAFGNSYGGNYAGLQGLGGLNALQNPAPAASYGQALAAAPAAPSSYSSYQAAPAAPAAPSSYSSYQAAPAAPAISKSTSSYGAQADATASTGYATTSYNAPASYASSSSNTASSYGSSYSKPSGSYGKSSGYNKPSGYGSSYGEQTGQPYGIQSTGDYANQQYYEEPLDLSRCGPTPSDNPCTAYGPQYFPLAGYPHCYIQCAFERMFVKPCPANLVWNARINVCDWPTVASYGSGYDNYGSGSSSYGSSSSSYGSGSSSYGRKKRFISPVPPLPLGAPFLPFGLPGPVGFPGPLGLGGFGLPGLPGPLGMPTPLGGAPGGIVPGGTPAPGPAPVSPGYGGATGSSGYGAAAGSSGYGGSYATQRAPAAAAPAPAAAGPAVGAPGPVAGAPGFPGAIPPPILPGVPPFFPPLPLPLGGPLLPPLPLSIPATLIPGPLFPFGPPFGGPFGGPLPPLGGPLGPLGGPLGPLGGPLGPLGGPLGPLGPLGFGGPLGGLGGLFGPVGISKKLLGGGYDDDYSDDYGSSYDSYDDSIYPVYDDDYSDNDDYDRGSYNKGYKKYNKKYGKKSYGGGYDKGYGDSSYSSYDNDYSSKYSKSDYKRNGNFNPNGGYGKSYNKYNDYSNDYYRKKRDYGSNSNVPALPPADSSFVVLGQSQIPLSNLCAGSSKKGNLPHPSDPTKYIACLDEKTQEIMDCPEGLIYISELDRCERPQSAEPLCESRNPCQNEGQCYQTGPSTVKCTCRAAWTGEFCETPVSSCASNPCGPGNTCHTLKTGDYKQDFVCVCDQGLSYGLSCDRNTVPNPCRAQSGEIELYHPFAFSANAFVQCDGEILHVQPCAEGLVWSQTQKGCRPIDFQEPQFDSYSTTSYETTLPPAASAYGSAISLSPAAPVMNSYSAPSVTFQTPVLPKNNYGSFQDRIISVKAPSSYSSSFVPSNPIPTPSSYGSFAPAAPVVRPTQYGQQTFIPSNPLPVSSYGGSVSATPIHKTVSLGQRSFTHSNPIRMSSYGSAPASPMPQPSSYGQQGLISNPTVSSYGSAPASPLSQPSAYGQQRMIFAPQMFKKVITRVAQPETSGY